MVSFKFFFLVVSVWEIDTPGAWSVLDQRGTVDYQTLLNTKYGALGLVVSEKIFFPIVSLWELFVAMGTTILIQSAPKFNAINPPPK